MVRAVLAQRAARLRNKTMGSRSPTAPAAWKQKFAAAWNGSAAIGVAGCRRMTPATGARLSPCGPRRGFDLR